MLFNSAPFVFGFLPLALAGFFLAARLEPRLGLAWLALASLVFYAWWNPLWLPLLLASMAGNLLVARALLRPTTALDLPRRLVFGAGIAGNLALLFWFKYARFAVDSLDALLGVHLPPPAVSLPVGISFFTFTQLAFLVDVWQRKAADADPLRYGLFVTYYPHLVAGPILHHADVMPQFAREDVFRFDAGRLADGAVVFLLGLFKKAVLADSLARFVGPVFDAAAQGQSPTFFEAWGGALSYTFQLYFDFSGYSDMAIGLALMIGVRLPANFCSPYQATDIASFWRRWHITLSRFLRDYLYVPLGGNRRGERRRQFNLMLTMLLGGLWHGAGWTFVVWGGLHGVYLAVHRAWRGSRRAASDEVAALAWPSAGRLAAWLLTFLAVVVAWVVFRADDLKAALAMLEGMAGLNGAALPAQLLALAPLLGGWVRAAGKVSYLADGTVMGAVEMSILITLGLALALATPPLQALRWRTRYLLVVPCAALALQRVVFGGSSEFLYFRF